ncbi:hypothetical protein GQ457_10G011030 [Hibiscus cannabinus]
MTRGNPDRPLLPSVDQVGDQDNHNAEANGNVGNVARPHAIQDHLNHILEDLNLGIHAIKAGVIHLLRPFSDEDQLGIWRVTSPSGSQGLEKGESAHQGKKPSREKHECECIFLGVEEHEEEYDGEIDDEQAYERATRQGLRRQEPRHQRARPRVDDNLDNIKINIPPFQGKTDLEAYLAWEKKIEHIFECHNYSELKKVKLTAIEFTDYALIWLDQLTASRRRNGERPISTWNEMKAVMRRRFILTHYHRELFNKLQNLTQGNRSVEDYYKEMEVAMIRANIDEDREATMARFLAGLDPNITAIVELQHYVEIEDMVHMAMKVERKLKKKGTTRAYGGLSTKWGQGPYKPKPTFSPNEKGGPSRNVKPIAETNKGKGTTMPARSRDVQCFKCLGRGHIASQCPNRNTMLLRDDGELESEQEEEENENDAIQEEEELEHAVEGEALIFKRSLSMQPMEGDEQRENIFHTRCHIGGKVCFVIIDGGSCTNVASTLMVEKLGLATTKHPRPYKLQWLNDGGELKVSKQVLIVFSIGKYKDEVLCDVVPMHAGQLLLGQPWQFDRRVVHDGYTNQYTFTHEARNITLAPLSPTQVQKDQIHLRNSFERAKEREAKIEPFLESIVEQDWNKVAILHHLSSSNRWSNISGEPGHTPFEVVYGFNPLTPLDLLPLPVEQIVNKDGHNKAEFVKKLHQQVRENIEKRTKQYERQANKGRKQVTFEPGDWVWLHMRKERFPIQRKSKLMPRGDGPFQVVKKINDNAYQLDLPGEFNVSATFNVADLSPYDVDEDLGTNRVKEGGTDAIPSSKDSEEYPRQFGGMPHEYSIHHIRNFLEVCDSFRKQGVHGDVLKIKLFPYSLRDRARARLSGVAAGSMESWSDLCKSFLLRYNPPNMNTQLRNGIASFRQIGDESMYECWDQYKSLLCKCSNHSFQEWTQVVIKFIGITFDILDRIASNDYQFLSSMLGIGRKALGVLELDAKDSVSTQLSAITNMLKSLQCSNKVKDVKATNSTCLLRPGEIKEPTILVSPLDNRISVNPKVFKQICHGIILTRVLRPNY